VLFGKCPTECLGNFLAGVPAPLGIRTTRLADGSKRLAGAIMARRDTGVVAFDMDINIYVYAYAQN
jgi:hypothetical protein